MHLRYSGATPYTLPPPPASRVTLPPVPHSAQERKVEVEELAEKLAGASRRAEKLVKEFEELGAGEGRMGGGQVKAVGGLYVAGAQGCNTHTHVDASCL